MVFFGLRFIGIGLALAYIAWNLHHEYSLKYLTAGSLNMAAWRAFNAASVDQDLSSLTDEALGIPRHPVSCQTGPNEITLPASCDMFGGDFGGKSRNCRYWWLGRKCYIFFVPQAVYERPDMRERLVHALSNPCRVLQDPGKSDTPSDGTLIPYQTRAWNAFGCAGNWLELPRQTNLHIVGLDGDFTVKTIAMGTANGR